MVVEAFESEQLHDFHVRRRLDQLVEAGVLDDIRYEKFDARDYRRLTFAAFDKLTPDTEPVLDIDNADAA